MIIINTITHPTVVTELIETSQVSLILFARFGSCLFNSDFPRHEGRLLLSEGRVRGVTPLGVDSLETASVSAETRCCHWHYLTFSLQLWCNSDILSCQFQHRDYRHMRSILLRISDLQSIESSNLWKLSTNSLPVESPGPPAALVNAAVSPLTLRQRLVGTLHSVRRGFVSCIFLVVIFFGLT